jgi:hypothetical protein
VRRNISTAARESGKAPSPETLDPIASIGAFLYVTETLGGVGPIVTLSRLVETPT